MAAKKSRKTTNTAVEVVHKTELHFDLDAEKIEAIHKCLKNGRLSITVQKVDLAVGGRAVGPYLYD